MTGFPVTSRLLKFAPSTSIKLHQPAAISPGKLRFADLKVEFVLSNSNNWYLLWLYWLFCFGGKLASMLF